MVMAQGRCRRADRHWTGSRWRTGVRCGNQLRRSRCRAGPRAARASSRLSKGARRARRRVEAVGAGDVVELCVLAKPVRRGCSVDVRQTKRGPGRVPPALGPPVARRRRPSLSIASIVLSPAIILPPSFVIATALACLLASCLLSELSFLFLSRRPLAVLPAPQRPFAKRSARQTPHLHVARRLRRLARWMKLE